jgi:hypothetical protein
MVQPVMPNFIETGLDWTGLDWTGLDWTGLVWLRIWTREELF